MFFNFFIQPRFHRDFNRNHYARIVMGVFVFWVTKFEDDKIGDDKILKFGSVWFRFGLVRFWSVYSNRTETSSVWVYRVNRTETDPNRTDRNTTQNQFARDKGRSVFGPILFRDECLSVGPFIRIQNRTRSCCSCNKVFNFIYIFRDHLVVFIKLINFNYELIEMQSNLPWDLLVVLNDLYDQSWSD